MLLFKFTTAFLCMIGASAASTKPNSNANAKALAQRDGDTLITRTYNSGCQDWNKVEACKKKVCTSHWSCLIS